ncbi:hypothetical protein CFC21_026064 [Triticum aestivum]|uniref:F-box associated domain-containing protein n=2 Tax=Triticum aestivum TaxID=4565 RepID=A0A3B6CF50_WHEAT|nr:hypothetical protein CFC21_026064 [Triticum aestivum]
MKARQFLNVVMQKYRNGSLYTVSRIKPEEQLFYGSTAEARAAAKSKTITRIPPPRLRLERSISLSDEERMDFLPFHEGSSGGASKILCVDAEGHTILYDMDAGSLQPIPHLNSPKGSRPIGFSATNREASDPERADAFYVMGRFPSSYGPYNFEECPVICHALLHIEGDSILVISSGQKSVGTYCFNTASRKWFKAGPWKLPFYSRAVHVPELDNLLFGIDNDEHHFCAMDISSRLLSKRGPPLVYTWPHLDLPEDWAMLDCSFVYLGAGRFCISKVFEFGFDERTGNMTEMGVVMSGVEVVRYKKSGLVMVNHRSKFYNCIWDDIQCVL